MDQGRRVFLSMDPGFCRREFLSMDRVVENFSLWTRVIENLLSLYVPDFGRRVFLSMAQDGREFLSRNPILGEEYFSL